MKKNASPAKNNQSTQHSPFVTNDKSSQGHDAEREPFIAGDSHQAIQCKLSVNAPNDPYEKEADQVADRVVQRLADQPHSDNKPAIQKYPAVTPISRLQTKCEKCEQEEKEEKEQQDNIPPLQRKPIFESRGEKEKPVQKKCKHCQEEEENVVQRKETNGQTEVPSSVESQLSNSVNSGRPLSPAVNQTMGQAFGSDFSDVRIHDDSQAADLSEGLQAQAFTHGNHIYFNEGKYDPSGKSGQHLLAHELTHTIQQGNGQSGPNSLHKKDDPPADPVPTPEGFAEEKGGVVNVYITDFQLKRYACTFNLDNGKDYLMPKEERKTDQKSIWKENTKDHVSGFVDKFVQDKSLQTEPLLMLTLKSNDATKVYGTKEQLKGEMAVPFWDLGGNATIHQVEHGIDWQVLGKDADHIDNLVLLDRRSNSQLGTAVRKNINANLRAIFKNYQSKIPALKNLSPTKAKKSASINIYFRRFQQEKDTGSGSIISKSNLGGKNEPYKQEYFQLEKANIPKGYFVLRTSADRAGYLLPYSPKGTLVGNFRLTTVGEPKLASIKLEPQVNDGRKVLVKAKDFDGVTIENDGETENVFLTNSQKLAIRMRDFIGVKYLSPIVLEEPELTPKFGLKVSGKVVTDVPFLKDNNIDISFELMDGDFSIQATITDIANFPKPFSVTYSSLFIRASSKEGLSVGGDLEFEIDKLGKGKLSALKGAEGFAITGKFEFDSKKFEGSNITATYKDNKWEIGGTLHVAKNQFKGIESASISVNYGKDGNQFLTFGGNAKLDIPGIDTLTIDGEIKDASNFRIHGKAGIKKMTGVKSGDIDATVTKTADDYELSMSGTAEPDLPKMPGELNTKLSISYNSKTDIFQAGADFEYTKGMVKVKVKIGVSNAAVEKGVLTESKGSKLVYFGTGTVTIKLIEDKADASFTATVKPGGELFVNGEANLKAIELMKEFKEEEELKFPGLHVPVIGVPFVSIYFEIGGGVKFYFNWKPLTLQGNITLPETDIQKLNQAKLTLNVSASSVATAGAGLQLSLRIGAEAAVVKAEGGIDGFAGLEITGSIGAGLKAELDLQNGLRLKELNGEIKVKPAAKFDLKGVIGVYLNLFFKQIKVWEWQKVLAEGSIDLSNLGGFEVTVPVKFDEKNAVIPPALKDIKVKKPEFSAQKGKELIDSVFNEKKKVDKPKENETKQQVRQSIETELRSKLGIGQSKGYTLDIQRIVTDIENKLTEKDQQVAEYELGIVEEEMKKITAEEFTSMEKELLTSTETLSSKLAIVDEFTAKWSKWLNKSLPASLKARLTREDASKSNTPVQRKPIFDSENEENLQDQRNKAIQREPATPQAGPSVESGIRSSIGQGSPLPPETKEEMQTAMGSELPEVTIHHDRQAAGLSEDLQANAFTYGRDIYFNEGKYDPSGKEGKRLLAHELTHVTQQQNGSIQRDDKPPKTKIVKAPGLVPLGGTFGPEVSFNTQADIIGQGSITITSSAKIIKSPEVLHYIKGPNGNERVPYEFVLVYERQVSLKTDKGSWIQFNMKGNAYLPYEKLIQQPDMDPIDAIRMASDFHSLTGDLQGDFGSDNVKQLLEKKLKEAGADPLTARQYLFSGTIGDYFHLTNAHRMLGMDTFAFIEAPRYARFFLTPIDQYNYLLEFMNDEMEKRIPKKIQPVKKGPVSAPNEKTEESIEAVGPGKPRKENKEGKAQPGSVKSQPVKGKGEVEEESEGFELPGWLVGILTALGKALLVIGAVLALAAIIVYFFPALAFAVVVKVIGSIILLGTFLYSLYTRYKEAKKNGNVSAARIIGVSILDAIGVSGIVESITDKSMLTGEKLNQSEKERWERGTTGVLALFGTLLGLRSWLKGGPASKLPPGTPKNIGKTGPATKLPPDIKPPDPATAPPVPDPVKPATPPEPAKAPPAPEANKPAVPADKIPDVAEPPKSDIPGGKPAPAKPSEPVQPAGPAKAPPAPEANKPAVPADKIPDVAEPPKSDKPGGKPAAPAKPSEPVKPAGPAPADGKSPSPATGKDGKAIPPKPAAPADKTTPPPTVDNTKPPGPATPPAPKRRIIIRPPEKTPTAPAAPAEPPVKSPKKTVKDPRSKPPVKDSEPKSDPAVPGTAGPASVNVGDKVSIPYKPNGARTRATVVEITPDEVVLEYSPKGTQNPSGNVRYKIPVEIFKQRVKDGDFIPWKGLRAWLMRSRPKYDKGLVEKVWNAAKDKDGVVRDPNPPHEVLQWDPARSRFDQWHMGHKPKYQYRDLVDKLVNEEISWEKFLEEYNKADNYRPEHPTKNMSHEYEEVELPGSDE